MLLEGTPRQRLITYYAEKGTPEYDAMLLLHAAADEPAAQPMTEHPHS
jgi:hypothetical protein